MVINKTDGTCSSMVAGGLYNPVTGHHMSKTWMADQLFSQILPFYTPLEQIIGRSIIHEIGIYRPFISLEECNDWHGKAASEVYAPYVKKLHMKTMGIKGINDPFGGIMLAKAGYIDVAALVMGFRQWLLKNGMYIEGEFDPKLLTMQIDGVTYSGITAKKIIFCQGVVGSNSYFDWLPFRPVKGELMEVSADTSFDFILNRGGFLVPLGAGKFRLGATYNWHLEGGFESKSEHELKEKIANVFELPMAIDAYKWGIRPATKDRRPFIGIHPQYSGLGIFNGFGSKGVSLVPYFAGQFSQFLKNNAAIDATVDINRYFSLT